MKWMKSGQDDAIADDLGAMQRYARSLARSHHDADDVVQDALVRAMERHKTFQPQRSRRRWLLAIVHNVFVSHKRRAAAESRRNERFAETLMAHVDPEQDHRLRLMQIARAFSELSDHHRAVLHLIAVEGLSYQEAADVLDVPVGTIMSRLARARAALQRGQTETKDRRTPLRVVGGQDD